MPKMSYLDRAQGSAGSSNRDRHGCGCVVDSSSAAVNVSDNVGSSNAGTGDFVVSFLQPWSRYNGTIRKHGLAKGGEGQSTKTRPAEATGGRSRVRGVGGVMVGGQRDAYL